jgi:hypothetical protein
LSPDEFRLPPLSFVVVTDDHEALVAVHPSIPAPILTLASLPALNNGGDAVVLFDEQGVVADSLFYDPLWGGSGFCLFCTTISIGTRFLRRAS